MKILSVRQPWAWAIMAGFKRYENRSWRTKYRGQILIHASASHISLRHTEFLDRLNIDHPKEFSYGAILGLVTVVDIFSADEVDNDFASGPLCWVLENPLQFAVPIPYKGGLGLRNCQLHIGKRKIIQPASQIVRPAIPNRLQSASVKV